MVEFQTTQKRERAFIAYKFNEAKNLVQRLTRERDSLQAQLEEAKKQLAEVTVRNEEASTTDRVAKEEVDYPESAQKKAFEEVLNLPFFYFASAADGDDVPFDRVVHIHFLHGIASFVTFASERRDVKRKMPNHDLKLLFLKVAM